MRRAWLTGLVALLLATSGAAATPVPLVPVREAVLAGVHGGTVVVSPDATSLYVLGGLDARTHVAVVARKPATGGTSGCAPRGTSRARGS